MEPDDEDQEHYLDDEDYLAFITENGNVYYDDDTRENYVVEEGE